MNDQKLIISVAESVFAVCHFEKGTQPPDWFDENDFYSLTKTADELSLVCREVIVPEGVQAERNWRMLKVEGPLDFALVGILAQLANALSEAGISIFAISTYDTDYILVKDDQLEKAITALEPFCTIK